jgi:hypothetical protein
MSSSNFSSPNANLAFIQQNNDHTLAQLNQQIEKDQREEKLKNLLSHISQMKKEAEQPVPAYTLNISRQEVIDSLQNDKDIVEILMAYPDLKGNKCTCILAIFLHHAYKKHAGVAVNYLWDLAISKDIHQEVINELARLRF